MEFGCVTAASKVKNQMCECKRNGRKMDRVKYDYPTVVIAISFRNSTLVLLFFINEYLCYFS